MKKILFFLLVIAMALPTETFGQRIWNNGCQANWGLGWNQFNTYYHPQLINHPGPWINNGWNNFQNTCNPFVAQQPFQIIWVQVQYIDAWGIVRTRWQQVRVPF